MYGHRWIYVMWTHVHREFFLPYLGCVSMCWIIIIVIQHIDTLPKYGHKAPDFHRFTWRISGDSGKFRIFMESENARCLQFYIFGKKNNKGKRKKKETGREKLLMTWLEQNGAKNFLLCRSVGEWKVVQSFKRSTRSEWRSTIFGKCFIVNTSKIWYRLDTSQRSFNGIET